MKTYQKLLIVVISCVTLQFVALRIPYINLLLPPWIVMLLFWFITATVFRLSAVYHVGFSVILLGFAFGSTVTAHYELAEIAGNMWYVVLFPAVIFRRWYPRSSSSTSVWKAIYPYRRIIVVTIIYCLLAVVTYGKLKGVFFQQDEFYAFGHVIASAKFGFLQFFQQSGYHLVPFAYGLVYVVYKMFGLQHQYYALLAIVLHVTASILVYRLSFILLPRRTAAYISGAVFLILTVYQQAVTWYAAIFSILPCVIFALSAAIEFIRYTQTSNKKYMWASFLLWAIGMGFKEDCLALVPVAGIYILMKQHGLQKYKSLISVTSVMVVYVLFRFMFWQNPGIGSSLGTASQIQYYIPRILIVPIAGIGQLFASPSLLLSIGRTLSRLFSSYFQPYFPGGSADLFAEQIVVPFLSLFIGAVVVLCFVFLMRIKKRQYAKELWVLLLWCISALGLFVFLPPGMAVESRHYYLSGVGWSIIVGQCVYVLYHFWRLLGKGIVVISICALIGINIHYTYVQLRFLNVQSGKRIQFIDQMLHTFPAFPSGSVIVSMGDPLPIQSGPGQYLMVLYSNRGSYEDFLQKNDFWSTNNGYKKYGSNGFGFFYNYDEFLTTYMTQRLFPEQIFAFRWDDRSGRVIDISDEVRTSLANSVIPTYKNTQ